MPETTARICAVIAEQTVEAARAAICRATPLADAIEVRLDYLRDFDFSRPEHLHALLDDRSVPAIITCRAVSEGGRQQIADDVRLRLLIEGSRRVADYCDIEAAYYPQAARLAPDPSRLIISYHNFEETPADLDGVYDRLRSLPAGIIKIATRARSITDTLTIFRLLDRAQAEGQRLIALAMQQPGFSTRVLGPAFGSFLTYGSLGRGRESAPGQADCAELRNLYRVGRISRATAITGLVGDPVAHSASPAMHNTGFAASKLDFLYLPLEVKDLAEFFARFVRSDSREIDWNLRGLSVTLPHKTSVIGLLDDIDPLAERAGAVNTVVYDDGRLKGYNTDVQGAIDPLKRICPLSQMRCAIIGAGGAARAVAYGLVEEGASVTVFARDQRKARSLGDSLPITVLPIESLSESEAQILINTTPVGMRGYDESASPVPRAALRNRPVAYDLVYNPIETEFLKEARAEGCRVVSGIEMLVAQAALQFELWTGHRAPVELMRAAAIEKLRSPLE